MKVHEKTQDKEGKPIKTTVEKRWNCLKCPPNKEFATRDLLQAHKKEIHAPESTVEDVKATCHKCNENFDYAITLNSHLLKCLKSYELKEFDCRKCDTSWYSGIFLLIYKKY